MALNTDPLGIVVECRRCGLALKDAVDDIYQNEVDDIYQNEVGQRRVTEGSPVVTSSVSGFRFRKHCRLRHQTESYVYEGAS